MSERQRETAFLKRLICCEDTAECRQLQQTIARVQSDTCCVQRAMWLMVVFISLAAAGAAYGAILLENFPDGPAPYFLKAIVVLGVTGLAGLAAFLTLLNVYRRRLNRLRSECRRIVMQRLESGPELSDVQTLTRAERPLIPRVAEVPALLEMEALSRFEGEGGPEAPALSFSKGNTK